MNYFKGFVSNVKGFYDGINPATLTGAIDVIVVRQEDGSLVGSPFHVRFGKLGVLRAREKVVDISVNDQDVDLHMKLGDAGEAFFVQECPEESFPTELATSPIPSMDDLMSEGVKQLHQASKEQDKLEIETSTQAFTYGSWGQEPGGTSNSLSEEGLLVPVISAERKQVDENQETSSPPTPKKDGTPLDSPEKHQNVSPARALPDGPTPSVSIPIPNGNNNRVRKMSDSDDQLSIACSPESLDFLTGEYPFSDMDVPIGTSVGTTNSGKERVDPRMVLSDTEAEIATAQQKERVKADTDVTWEWGELPQGPVKIERGTQNESGRKKRSEKTSKSKSKHLSEGLYLDDVLQADAEVAALYLNRQSSYPEIDIDSGIGQDSKPVSPIESYKTTDKKKSNQEKEIGFDASISLSLCGDLKRGKVDSEKFREAMVSFEEFCKNPSILNDPKLVIKMNNKYYNWQVAAPYVMALVAYRKPLHRETVKSLKQQYMPRKRKGWFSWRTTNDEQDSSDEDEIGAKKAERPHRVRSFKSDTSTESDVSHHDQRGKTKDRYKKVTRLSSSQWASLGLRDGENSITFSVTTQYQGTASCTAKIFLWNWCDNIVISDIDGTITRSDVFGQILPYVGKDWSQAGVTGLFTNIAKNGYRFVYLSARAIGQAELTRNFLRSVQQGELRLPSGPVLLSPTSLVTAFQKEVIEKKPEEFKIACLKDIKKIFPPNRSPFYSGFGNRVNDVWAYRALGIPISRIFTINYKGEIKHELTCAFSSSYAKLDSLVDQIFPPTIDSVAIDEICSDFSTFNYWKTPFPDVGDNLSISDDENIGL
ncbi:phosphatidate phosphatase LPIN3-like [Rhopilema esculentum]|uniref:phosphatidate phosphatase LPIN3-like n=1 Tax=Rhopilema esculentum TaxID=499914 RepID=UPI0031CF1105